MTPADLALGLGEHPGVAELPPDIARIGCADTDSIASQWVIGKTTVRDPIQRMLQKLGVYRRLEAVTDARMHYLID